MNETRRSASLPAEAAGAMRAPGGNEMTMKTIDQARTAAAGSKGMLARFGRAMAAYLALIAALIVFGVAGTTPAAARPPVSNGCTLINSTFGTPLSVYKSLAIPYGAFSPGERISYNFVAGGMMDGGTLAIKTGGTTLVNSFSDKQGSFLSNDLTGSLTIDFMTGFDGSSLQMTCEVDDTASTVQLPAAITTEPQNQATTVGAPVAFNVVTTRAIRYQWEVADGEWGPVANDAQYSGATTAQLVIKPSSTALSGTLYRVVVYGVDGTEPVTSQAVGLTVTLTVTPEADVKLTALSVAGGSLDPAFSPDITSYVAVLPSERAASSIRPVTAKSSANLTVNGKYAGSGGDFGPISLNYGDNVMHVRVTNGSKTATYTINIIRTPVIPLEITQQPVSQTVDMGQTALFTVTANDPTKVARYFWQYYLGPSPGWTDIPGGISAYDGQGQPTLRVTPDSTDFDGMKYRALLYESPSSAPIISNEVTLTLTGTAKSEAKLISLLIPSGTALTPAFDPSVTHYTTTVANEISGWMVTPNVSEGATLTINGAPATPGERTMIAFPTPGAINSIAFVVTAEDGLATTTYTLDVTREAGSLSSDSTLSSLTVSAGTLTPAFDPEVTMYSVTVGYEVETLSLTPTASNANATIKTMTSEVVPSGVATVPVNLNVGYNSFMFQVWAEDNSGVKTYIIGVTRKSEADSVAISQQPQDVEVDLNELARFSVTATGGVTGYQWQYRRAGETSEGDWQDLHGDTAAELSIEAIPGLNGYQFRVVVKGPGEQSLISDAATLSVRQPAAPEITQQPVDIEADPLATVYFSVTATGDITGYQWQYRLAGDTSESGWTNAGGADKAREYAVWAKPWKTGMQHRVIVYGPGGTSVVSDPATLFVKKLVAEITQQPQDQAIAEGDSASFTVVATNAERYQWQARSADADTWFDLTEGDGPAYSGLTAATLTVTPGDDFLSYIGNQYRVVVYGADDEVGIVSNAAALSRKTPQLSHDARLVDIARPASLGIEFDPDRTEYTATVSADTTEVPGVRLNPAAGATLTLNGDPVQPDERLTLPLPTPGEHSFVVVVTAEDGVTTRTYTFKITREEVALGHDATLSALEFSAGSIDPAFSPEVRAYTVTVPYDIEEISVTATTADSGATLSIRDTAVVSGTPFGPFALTVGRNKVGIMVTSEDRLADAGYAVTVYREAPPEDIVLLPSSGALPAGMVGEFYQQQFTASGGVEPYKFVLGGDNPPGMKLDQATGLFSGTPTTAFDFKPRVIVIDADNTTVSQDYTWPVSDPSGPVVITLSPAAGDLPKGSVGQPYQQQFTASGGTEPYRFILDEDNPPGMNLDEATGLFSGTPTMAGTFHSRVMVVDADEVSVAQDYAWLVEDSAVAFTFTPDDGAALKEGMVGEAYSQSISATGGSGALTYRLASGELPKGIMLSALTGALMGSVDATAEAKDYAFTVEVSDGSNATGTASYTLTVTKRPVSFTFTPADGAVLKEAMAGEAYSQSISATGGNGVLTYRLASGDLPKGVILDASTGALSGSVDISAEAKDYSFTIEVRDGSNATGTARYTLTVTKRPVSFTFTPADGAVLKEAMAGEAYSQPISATGGTGTLTYRLAGGDLPKGMILNLSTGELTGPLDAAAEAKVYGFTIEVSDGANATGTASYRLTVVEQTVSVTDKTITVPAGSTPPNVDLEEGATGGPFPSAEVTFVDPPNAGSARTVQGEFAAIGPTPLGWYLKFTPNPAYSGTVKVGFKLTGALGTSNTGVVTYLVGYDAGAVAGDIDGLVKGFVQTRQGLIASTLTVPGLIERRQMQNAADPVTLRMTPAADGLSTSFATSLAQMQAAEGYDAPFNIWIDGTIMLHNREENDNRWGSFAMVNLGADYLLSEKVLLGLSVHYDRMTDPIDEDGELTGDGWLVGPYASIELGTGVIWNTSVLYGGSANQIDTAFWDGSFDTTRWMIDTVLTGEWRLDAVTTLTPKLRAVYFSETVQDYTVENGAGDIIDLEGFNQEQFRVSLGAELARAFTLDNDLVLTPKLGVTGGFSGLDGSGAFGSLSAGLSLQSPDAWSLEAGLLFNIEGDGQKSVGAKAGISGKF